MLVLVRVLVLRGVVVLVEVVVVPIELSLWASVGSSSELSSEDVNPNHNSGHHVDVSILFQDFVKDPLNERQMKKP